MICGLKDYYCYTHNHVSIFANSFYLLIFKDSTSARFSTVFIEQSVHQSPRYANPSSARYARISLLLSLISKDNNYKHVNT